MFKKTAIIIIIILVGGLVYYAVRKSSEANLTGGKLKSITLDKNHQIVDASQIPTRNLNGDTLSPNTGEVLEEIILEGEMIYNESEESSLEFLTAYYSASENLNWIKEKVKNSGERWYGPYEGKITPLTKIEK